MVELVDGRLSDAHIAAYEHDGFLVVDNLFEGGELALARTAFEELQAKAESLDEVVHGEKAVEVHGLGASVFRLDKAYGSLRLLRANWCGGEQPVLFALSHEDRFILPASQLLGYDHVVQLSNQAHFKLPGDRVGFQFHQDAHYRGQGDPTKWVDVNGKGSSVNCVLAIDEMNVENGPLLVFPGSHAEGFQRLSYDETAERFPLWKAQPVLMTPGSVAFFGPFLVHGSIPNESGGPRRTLINTYAAPGANRQRYIGAGFGVELRPGR